MQAIGMIETKGLLTLIEAADAMVKSANVNILEKVHIGGGYVSIIITGDVAAVKSSVDAGVSAVNRIDEKSLVSHHVIARPHCDIECILETTLDIDRQKEELNKIVQEEIDLPNITDEELSIEENIEIDSKLEDSGSVDMLEDVVEEVEEVEEVVENEMFANLDVEEVVENKEPINIDDLTREDIDKILDEKGLDEVINLLNSLRISKLRKLAREYKELELTNKAISKIDKKTLIMKLQENYKNK